MAPRQVATGTAAAAPSVTATLGAAPEPGDLLVALWWYAHTPFVTNPTAAIPAGWLGALFSAFGGEFGLHLMYRVAGAAEPATVTCTLTGANTNQNQELHLVEYGSAYTGTIPHPPGAPAPGPLDVTDNDGGVAANSTTGQTVTAYAVPDPAVAGVVVAGIGCAETGPFTVNPGPFANAWTNGFVRRSVLSHSTLADYSTAAGAGGGVFSTTESWTFADDWIAHMAAFDVVAAVSGWTVGWLA